MKEWYDDFKQILDIPKKGIKDDFCEIKKLAESLGTTPEIILSYIIANKLTQLNDILLNDNLHVKTSEEKE